MARLLSPFLACILVFQASCLAPTTSRRSDVADVLVLLENRGSLPKHLADSLAAWLGASERAGTGLRQARIRVTWLLGPVLEESWDELLQKIRAWDPDVVALQAGVREAAQVSSLSEDEVGRFGDVLRECVATIRRDGRECVLITPNPARRTEVDTLDESIRYDAAGQDRFVRAYAWAVRNLARTEGLRLVDAFKVLEEGETRGRWRVADLLQNGRYLSAAGCRALAEELAETLTEALEADEPPEKLPPSLAKHDFGVPLVDLASDSARQVVVDREPGQYLGHPSSVLLEDGNTILVVYPKGHGRGPIVLKRSRDGGLTWSERLPVPESWATSKETPTIYRITDSTGKRRLILFSGLYPIRSAVSEDDGQTWTELGPIGDYGGIVAVASLVRLTDGRWMALFHDDGRFLRGSGRRAATMTVYKILSEDGGLSWSEPVPIASLPYAHLCEPGAVRSPDGSQIAVLLRENLRRYNSFVMFSDDEGETWTEPRELPGALTGDRHVAQYLPNGRLFISFRDRTPDAGSPTEGDWAGWIGTYDDLVEGRDGQYRLRLADNRRDWDCCYPTTHLLPDGTVVTITYGHWREGESPYILEVRFTAEEIDRLAGRQGKP